MTMKRVWVARCDAPDCPASVIAEESDLDKADFGMSINDAGWQAGPGRPKQFCPDHRTDPKDPDYE